MILPPSRANFIVSGSLNLTETTGPIRSCTGIALHWYKYFRFYWASLFFYIFNSLRTK